MSVITVLTCFSYSENKQYVFHPKYLRSDLRRICDYCLNYTNSNYQNMYILTDLVPHFSTQQEIQKGFQRQVLALIKKHYPQVRILKRFQNCKDPPLHWLKNICQNLSVQLNESSSFYDPSKLFQSILKRVLPILRTNNVIEFLSLFANFYLINGKKHYHSILNATFRQLSSDSKLIFYYTGHGVQHYNNLATRNICLVIPTTTPDVEFYSRTELIHIFSQIPSSVSIFCVFDCCYAQALLNLPFQKGFNAIGQIYTEVSDQTTGLIVHQNIICLTSTSNDQTCGFYAGAEECGSVFTYYLIQCLQKIAHGARSSSFYQLFTEVEQKVVEYRLENNKTSQNMLIQLNRDGISKLPKWLFPKRKK